MKEEIKKHSQAWLFYLTIGLILIGVYKLLDSMDVISSFFKGMFSVLAPFLAGLLLAYLLYIPQNKIEKLFRRSSNIILRKKSRTLAIICTYLIALLVLIIIINFIFPVLINSINELISNLQNYYAKIIETYNKMPNDSIFKTEQVYSAIKDLQNLDVKQYLSVEKITTYVKSVFGVARGVFDIFVAIVVSIYILSERTEIIRFFKRFVAATFKEDTYRRIVRYFYKSNQVFFKFVSSQLLDAVVVGIVSSIVMNLLKIKYGTLLGFTIGLFNMIPYFGAIIAIVISAFITLITGGLSKTIIMLIIIILFQQIDANIINPKIVGDSLKISPLIVILAVTIGGAYFGIIGMFLGVPIACVLKILVNDYIDNKLKI